MPTINSVHINRPLENLAIAYIQERNYLADLVFPMVPVPNKSDSYYTFAVNAFRKNRAAYRAEGTEAQILDVQPTSATFTCRRRAAKHRIPDPTRANADNPLDLDRVGMELVAHDVMQTIEADWVAKFFTTSVWTGSSSGSDITPSVLWDNDTSTPIEDVRDQLRIVKRNTGFRPNVGVLGATVFDDLINHPDVLDRIKYMAGVGNPAIASEQALAALFGVERIVVATASRDTAADGKAASNAFIADAESALFVYANPRPSIMAPSGGYQFVWGGTGNATGLSVKTYREPEALESDAVEVEKWFDLKLTGADLGVFFSNAVNA